MFTLYLSADVKDRVPIGYIDCSDSFDTNATVTIFNNIKKDSINDIKIIQSFGNESNENVYNLKDAANVISLKMEKGINYLYVDAANINIQISVRFELDINESKYIKSYGYDIK